MRSTASENPGIWCRSFFVKEDLSETILLFQRDEGKGKSVKVVIKEVEENTAKKQLSSPEGISNTSQRDWTVASVEEK
ncbi:hypothetical protein M4D70_24325 [Brevibacillus borstelensis]|uniref:hypothetical protein n=1 Tax=Brevibacillus borstelensis TaxID=45462 RepID=UPI0012DF2FC0|nr:hypothetical protein [Brevibacillus borstelensis]MCM3625324.1 hypothetical protein [Brevibacillus borstelensis]